MKSSCRCPLCLSHAASTYPWLEMIWRRLLLSRGRSKLTAAIARSPRSHHQEARDQACLCGLYQRLSPHNPRHRLPSVLQVRVAACLLPSAREGNAACFAACDQRAAKVHGGGGPPFAIWGESRHERRDVTPKAEVVAETGPFFCSSLPLFRTAHKAHHSPTTPFELYCGVCSS
jgi:hypothetical protein